METHRTGGEDVQINDTAQTKYLNSLLQIEVEFEISNSNSLLRNTLKMCHAELVQHLSRARV